MRRQRTIGFQIGSQKNRWKRRSKNLTVPLLKNLTDRRGRASIAASVTRPTSPMCGTSRFIPAPPSRLTVLGRRMIFGQCCALRSPCEAASSAMVRAGDRPGPGRSTSRTRRQLSRKVRRTRIAPTRSGVCAPTPEDEIAIPSNGMDAASRAASRNSPASTMARETRDADVPGIARCCSSGSRGRRASSKVPTASPPVERGSP